MSAVATLAELAADLEEAIVALSDDPTSNKGRDTLRRMRGVLDRWQASNDLVGLAGGCASPEEAQNFVDTVIYEIASTNPRDPMIVKLVSALLDQDSSRLTPSLVEQLRQLLRPFDDLSPEKWDFLQDRMARTLIASAAASQFPHDPAGRSKAVADAQEAIRQSRASSWALQRQGSEGPVDDEKGAVKLSRRDWMSVRRLVTTALDDEDAEMARLLLMQYGHVLTPGTQNQLLATSVGDGRLHDAAVVINDYLGPSGVILNKRIREAILRACLSIIMSLEDSGPDERTIAEFLCSLTPFGLLTSSRSSPVARFLSSLMRSEFCSVAKIVAAMGPCLKGSDVDAATRGTIVALALASLGQSEDPTSDDLEQLYELGSCEPGIADADPRVLTTWKDMAGDLSTTQATGLLKYLVLGQRGLDVGVRPRMRLELSSSHRSNLTHGCRQLLAKSDTDAQAQDVSEILDVMVASQTIKVWNAVGLLALFPSGSPERRAKDALAAIPNTEAMDFVTSSELIGAARAEAAIALGDIHAGLKRLAATPVTKSSVPLRLKVLHALAPVGNEFTQTLTRLCSLDHPRDLLDAPSGSPNSQAATEALLTQALDDTARANGQSAIKALTNDLGFQVKSRGDLDEWEPFTQMPMWLVSSWATMLDVQRRRTQSAALLDACFAEARARQIPSVTRVLQLAALRCEKYARTGGGYRSIFQLAQQIRKYLDKEDPTRTIRDHPANRTYILSIYEQLLVATKKIDRVDAFQRPRGVKATLKSTYGLDPSAGIWTTVILGAMSRSTHDGLAMWLQAVSPAGLTSPINLPDDFFSARESAAIAASFCRLVNHKDFDHALERLTSGALDPFEAHAQGLRIISDVMVAEGDIEGLMRLQEISRRTAQLTSDPDIESSARYSIQSQFPCLAKALATGILEPADVRTRAELALSGLANDATDRQLDALSEILVTLASLDNDAGLFELVRVIQLEQRAQDRLLLRLVALSVTRLEPGAPLRADVVSEAHNRQITIGPQLQAAIDAPTLEAARDAAGEITGLAPPSEPMMTFSQFHAFAELLRHELQPAGILLHDLTFYLQTLLEAGDATGEVLCQRGRLNGFLEASQKAGVGMQALMLQLRDAASRRDHNLPTVQTVRDVCSAYGGHVRLEEPNEEVATLRTTMRADSLTLVLHTLLRNALEASANSTTVTVHRLPPSSTDLQNTSGWFVVAIANDGESIPHEIVNRIHESRLPDRPELGGVGTTLASTNLRLAGGWLRVSDGSDGHGALVSLGLPLKGDDDA